MYLSYGRGKSPWSGYITWTIFESSRPSLFAMFSEPEIVVFCGAVILCALSVKRLNNSYKDV